MLIIVREDDFRGINTACLFLCLSSSRCSFLQYHTAVAEEGDAREDSSEETRPY